MRNHINSSGILLYAFVLFIGCDRSPPVFTILPAVTANPNPNVPLAALISFTTDEPATASITVDDGQKGWTRTFGDTMKTDHMLPVFGLRPDQMHEISIEVKDAVGNQVKAPEVLTFKTKPLPDFFPPLAVPIAHPDKMEPGITLFSPFQINEDDKGIIIAVDEIGQVVWYYQADHPIEDLRRLQNGHLMYIYEDRIAREIDMLGNTVQEWYAAKHNPEGPEGAIAVNMESLHHEVFEMPSGTFLTLSTEIREMDFPTNMSDPKAPRKPANVVGDVIVEFDRDGTMVHEWKLFDLLDVNRLGFSSLSGFWNGRMYRDVKGGTKDWTHANAVIYDARDDAYVVSLRHLDAVVKIGRNTGDIKWILGHHTNWNSDLSKYLLQPVGPLDWPYHQHAPMVTPAGTLLMYDNGNFKAFPYDKPMAATENYSRAVEFAIDTDAMTVSQIWHYGGRPDEHFYAPFLGDADWMPTTGHILITDGGHVDDKNGNPSDNINGGHHWARIIEVTHTQPSEKVFELIIRDPETEWSVYRSERLKGLYP